MRHPALALLLTLALVPASPVAGGTPLRMQGPALAAKLDPRLAAAALPGAEPVAVWVEFADKGETGPADLADRLAEAARALTPEARHRREKAHVTPLVDWLDLPLEPAYVRALQDQGYDVFGQSRWFNRVAVHVASERLRHLAELVFVRHLTPVELAAPRRPEPELAGEPAPEVAPAGPNRHARPSAIEVLYGKTLGQMTRLNVPAVRLEKVLGQDIYLIERFDRIQDGDGTRRLPFISGLTIIGAHESESSRQSYRRLAEQLRLFGASPAKDAQELWQRMVFNILCNNNDDHLRNHGFLWDGKGWHLSPAYDIVPFPQVSLERDLAIGVGSNGRRATLHNALSEVASFGLSGNDAMAMARAMAPRKSEMGKVSTRISLTVRVL